MNTHIASNYRIIQHNYFQLLSKKQNFLCKIFMGFSSENLHLNLQYLIQV